MKNEYPEKPGVYRASLSRGTKVIASALIDVVAYSGRSDMNEGGIAKLMDGSDRMFELSTARQQQVKLCIAGKPIRNPDVRVTWLGECPARPGEGV